MLLLLDEGFTTEPNQGFQAMHGKMTVLSALLLIMVFPPPSLSDDREAAVRAVIQSFYKAFDEGFTGPDAETTPLLGKVNP
jgi:hypothetical protein